MRPPESPLLAWVLLAGAWTGAFSLACVLTASNPMPASEAGLTDILLGESRQALSTTFFNQADLYFHKGVGHIESTVATHSLFQSWQASITPEEHAHAEGVGSAEILPWLKLAIGSDPHNVEAFLVAAFWAATGLTRPDLAYQILAEAQRLNPGDYRIPLERGRLDVRAGNYDDAARALDFVLTLQDRNPPAGGEPDRQFALDKAEALVVRGFLCEIQGDSLKAIRYFKNALAIFPERVYIKERVALLETGQTPPEPARSLLEKLTQRSVHDACHEEEGHDHDHSGKDSGHSD